jgi:hypothetical protein
MGREALAFSRGLIRGVGKRLDQSKYVLRLNQRLPFPWG